jgi:uncharacterized protein
MSSGIQATRVISGPARWLLQALAVVCVGLGLLGILVPVLPTVPFLLVAAWAASRSSPRLAHWLETHPRFGHYLRDWHAAGVVPRSGKWAATIMMSASGALMLTFVRPLWVPLLAVITMALVGAWLWRRPERRPVQPS